jgi:predicted kinase
MTGRTEALLVGGRAGVGKSSVGYEIHEQLSAAGLRQWRERRDSGYLGRSSHEEAL